MNRIYVVAIALSGCLSGNDVSLQDSVDDVGEYASVRVAAGDTKHAELVELLPVGRSEDGAKRRVVMRLDPFELPSLASGDRLITPAEVQVTVRCDIGQTAPGCDYNPNVRAQIILAGNAGATTGRVIATQTQTCTHESHHCVFTFIPSDATLELRNDIPCVATDRCHVSLVMWAWNANARPGDVDKVLVATNDHNYLDNGKVDGDGSRLMAIRERDITAADRDRRDSSGTGNRGVNTNANPVVIYSHELGTDIAADTQFVIEAKVVARTSDRARVSTYLMLARDPDATDPSRFDASDPGQLGEQNGYNCTPGMSPCDLHKVVVFRANRDIAGKLYVNVVAKAAVPGPGTASVVVDRDAGWVRSTRYAARLY